MTPITKRRTAITMDATSQSWPGSSKATNGSGSCAKTT